MIEDKGHVLFEWEVPKDWPNFSGIDDIPSAYRVISRPTAVGGLYVEARYGDGSWFANPSSMRPLVRKLLQLLGKIE